ncbi:response regulator [Waterburya agarophytonicola K14]|uniref:Response regulator n=1 Tax=Waterburya agarophytonicola KI4 TaxID=2874699 RepID=A0A964BQ03_9CYAN|nr:response regulator [Waterburya agarophytonicola]MCC0176363.1 response regulator [Waterburya agarophytonicola KI4]
MNNSLQNPLKVLHTKSKECWSGCLEILEPKDPSVSWQVYLFQGKIQYISITAGQQTRLNYLWQQFRLGSKCPDLEDFHQKTSEYTQLCKWLFDKKLENDQIKKLLFMFVREGLINVLSIKETSIELKPGKRITKALISFELTKLIANEPIKAQVKAWQEVRKYYFSTASRLYIEQKNALKFYKIWKDLYTKPELKKLASSQKLSSFVSLFVAKSNLYEIATKAKVDTYFLVNYLQKPIEENILEQLPFGEVIVADEPRENNDNSHVNTGDNRDRQSSNVIVCIDDSKTVQKQVKMTLEAAGYQVFGILDPTMALKDLSEHQPLMIFMDINMPDINGYDLCALLRKSQKFKEIPIVMLTGRDGMIDRVRAKIAGANDYLTKPCDPNKLIAMAKILEHSMVTAP